jgi:GT2 family glycosyltransferase
VIVNWNVRELLQRCLHSILRSAIPVPHTPGIWQYRSVDLPIWRFEILVIDSASEDDSVSMVKTEFPHVRLYASERNLGYTGGNNLGMRQSQGCYVLLLNPDTEVLDDALAAMVGYMACNPQVAVVGPQLLWPDGSVQSSQRRFPSLHTALIESTFLQKWFPNHPALRHYYMQDRPDSEAGAVDWLNGSCLLVRRNVIEQVGLLDDRFFMYSEELDWQKRIVDAGWKVVYLPRARVVHHEGKSSGQVVAFRHIRFSTSKVLYFLKHHGRPAAALVRHWLLLNYFYEWSVEALKWCAGHKRDLRRERMRVYGQVLRSRLEEE